MYNHGLTLDEEDGMQYTNALEEEALKSEDSLTMLEIALL